MFQILSYLPYYFPGYKYQWHGPEISLATGVRCYRTEPQPQWRGNMAGWYELWVIGRLTEGDGDLSWNTFKNKSKKRNGRHREVWICQKHIGMFCQEIQYRCHLSFVKSPPWYFSLFHAWWRKIMLVSWVTEQEGAPVINLGIVQEPSASSSTLENTGGPLIFSFLVHLLLRLAYEEFLKMGFPSAIEKAEPI